MKEEQTKVQSVSSRGHAVYFRGGFVCNGLDTKARMFHHS